MACGLFLMSWSVFTLPLPRRVCPPGHKQPEQADSPAAGPGAVAGGPGGAPHPDPLQHHRGLPAVQTGLHVQRLQVGSRSTN